MSIVSQATADRVVIYDKPTSGDLEAPFNDPVGNNQKVYFCSDWGVYVIHAMGTKTINHVAVAGYTPAPPASGFPSGATIGDSATHQYSVINHNLGYPPRCMLALNGNILLNGMQVQRLTGRMRSVSAFVDNNTMYIWDWGNSTDQALPAISLTYNYVIFREPTSDDDLPGFLAQPGLGIMGHGRINTARRTMRQISTGDDTPFWLSGAPAMGLLAARWCFALADGTIVDEPGYFGPFQPPSTTRIGPN